MKKYCLLVLSLCGLSLVNGCNAGSSTTLRPPPAATHLSVTAPSVAPVAGTPFNVIVKALDVSGAVVSTYSGTVHFTTTDIQAVLPPASMLAGGTGTFSVTFKTAGSQTIYVTDMSTASVGGILGSITVSSAAPARFTVAVPSTVTAGLPFTVTVNATDAYSNAAINYSGTVRFTSTDAQATLPPNSTLNGTGTFSATLKSIGIPTVITATDTSTASIAGNSSSINVVSNAATQFSIGRYPSAVLTRQTFSFTIVAADAANNVSTGYTGTVHFTSTDTQAKLPANSTLTAGISNFSATLETAGNQTITTTDTAASITDKFSITVTAAPSLSITSGSPPNGTVGVQYGPSTTTYTRCNVYMGSRSCRPCTPDPGPEACGSGPRCSPPFFIGCSCYHPIIFGSCVLVSTFTGFPLEATGGVPPYKWSATGIPAGLSVNPSRGEISGTPTSVNTYHINVTVTDSGSPATPKSPNYTITIAPPPVPIVNTTPPPPPGVENQPYTYTITASGYPPLTWSKSGPLPNGLGFDTSTGILSGTPTVANSFPIMVTATDQFNQASTATNFTIVVSAHGFQAIGNMTIARQKQTATLLGNGKVLVAGGEPNDTRILNTAELYDPAAGTNGTFTPTTGNMVMPRIQHTATLLQNMPTGKVLVAGGRTDAQGDATATAELYDPVAGTFTPTNGPMGTPRATPTATLLGNGLVLVTGGAGASVSALATAELYEPANGAFKPTDNNMGTARNAHTATLLADGKVLVSGGADASSIHLKTAEIFDPATGKFTPVPGMMTVTRAFHTATLLSSGKVLVAGGVDDAGKALKTAELFDPSNGSFTATTDMVSAHASHTATLLNDGTVLLAGGLDAGLNPLAAVELFNPATGSFASTGSLVTARHQHTATLLSNGKVLATGGTGGTSGLSSAEIYQ